MKKSHRKRRGNRAVLIFLMTMNLINEPATRIPRRLLIYQTSGKITTSTTAIPIERMIERIMMRGVLFRNIEVMSMK